MMLRCPVCHKSLLSKGVLCEECAKVLDSECFDELMERCPKCHYPIVSSTYRCTHCTREACIPVYSVARYDGDLSYAIITSFKFRSHSELAPVVALYLSRALDKLDPEHRATIVPIPCSQESLSRNGWDHMALVSEHLGRPVANILLSQKGPRQQKLLSRTERLSQEGRFTLSSCPGLPRTAPIIVVDDICTTMGTMRSAISTLKDAGFENVCGASWLLDFVQSGGDLSSDMI